MRKSKTFRMRLKDLLPHLFFCEKIKIYVEGEDEETYFGSAYEVPWSLAETLYIETRYPQEDGSISTVAEDGRSIMIINCVEC